MLARVIATVFGLGYFPVAPGTVGALAGVLYYYFLMLVFSPESTSVLVFYILSMLVVGGVGVWASGKAVHLLDGGKDPREVVIDEFLSILITMFLIPYSHSAMAIGFVLNRLLDIVKPYPAGKAEKLPGGWGIMLDDIISGIYANLLLRGIVVLAGR